MITRSNFIRVFKLSKMNFDVTYAIVIRAVTNLGTSPTLMRKSKLQLRKIKIDIQA
jgi:hypothetical protein